MPATPFDSAHLSRLFPTGELSRLFSDTAEVRAMMITWGALAKAQGARGVIPETAAAAIHRASMELQIDPGGLGESVGQNAVTVPGLVAAFRTEMQAPEHAQYLHWGATSQDIQDTALMLRLRQALAAMDGEIGTALAGLARLAEAHAETPMAARTYGQDATPTSFGAVVAEWGWALLSARQALARVKEECLLVSLSGAAGTGAALGPHAAALRGDLAEALGLRDPGHSWHSDRTAVMRIAAASVEAAVAAGRMGEDLILMVQSGVGEVRLGGSGGSSTMPQKQNPVAPSAMVALARHAAGLNGTLQAAGLHRQQRDGAAWMTEWLTLPQLMMSAGAALGHAARLAEGLEPNAEAMAAHLDASGGLILSEALSFALAARMPRPEAQAETKRLAKAAQAAGTTLEQAARAEYPDLPEGLFDPARQMGDAPASARAFAAAAREGH